MKRKYVWSFLIMTLLVFGVTIASPHYFTYAASEQKKKIKGADDLPGAHIGVQIGTTGDIYISDYEKDGSGTTIERYNKAGDAIQALLQNKIECVVLDEQPAKAFAGQNPSLAILDEEFTIEDYAICVAKGNSELKEKLNASLDKLKRDNTIASIVSNYIGTEEEKGKHPYEKKELPNPQGTLVMGTNASFQPYEYYHNGKIVGIDADIMQAIADDLQMELKIEDMEFDSIITAVSSGKVDVGMAGMTVTEERKKNVDFSDSYATAKQVIIVNTGEEAGAKQSFLDKLRANFVTDGRYQYLLTGLKNTLMITLFSLIIGILLGFLIAIIRTSHDQNGGLTILNAICRLYLTVMRGTPAMIQLLIIYYVVFASVDANKILVATIAFGLNSAAYVAEVVRSGIMSVDVGQFEAGRSMGLTYRTTMIYIILPQAIKNILPALLNEFISLLKETSISGYIGLVDLTKGGDIIRSITWEAFIPLVAVALVYLTIVVLLTFLVNRLERRLRSNERN